MNWRLQDCKRGVEISYKQVIWYIPLFCQHIACSSGNAAISAPSPVHAKPLSPTDSPFLSSWNSSQVRPSCQGVAHGMRNARPHSMHSPKLTPVPSGFSIRAEQLEYGQYTFISSGIAASVCRLPNILNDSSGRTRSHCQGQAHWGNRLRDSSHWGHHSLPWPPNGLSNMAHRMHEHNLPKTARVLRTNYLVELLLHKYCKQPSKKETIEGIEDSFLMVVYHEKDHPHTLSQDIFIYFFNWWL